MEIKKLLAGAAAATLAVSSLAAGAFATDYPWTEPSSSYQCSYEFTKEIPGTTTLDNLEIVIASCQGPDYPGVVDYKVVVEYFDKSSNLKTYETSKSNLWMWGTETINVPVSSQAGFSGITNRQAGTPMKVTVTGTMQSGNKDLYKKDEAVPSGLTVTVNGDAANSKVTSDVKENKSEGVAKSPITFTKYKKPQLRDMANGGTIEFTFDADPKVVGYITVNFTGAANGAKDSTVNVVISNKKATVDLPKNFTYYYDSDDEEAYYADKDTAISFVLSASAVKDKDGKEEPIEITSITIKTGATTAEDTTVAEAEVTTDKPAETNEAQKPADVTTAAEDEKPVNNGGNDGNPPTGLAIAVVPAVISAAGAIIAKKRK